MANDPYTGDETDDTYREVHGDDPVRDQYADDATDDGFFPSGASGRVSGWGVLPSRSAGDAADATEAKHGEGGQRESSESVSGVGDESDSWWDEGLITLLLVGGLALFLFPEPVTSAVGLVLMGAGVVLGIVDWLL